MHYNPLAYVRNEADILKFVNTLISNTKGEGKESDPFWTKSDTLLYCALLAYIILEGPPEARNMNTLVDMISGMEVKENDEDYMNAVDYMFAGLEKRKPDCFAVKQYKKYKLASGKTAKSILISCGARLAPFDTVSYTHLGDTKETTIPQGEHEFSTTVISATCTSPGYTIRECAVCGERHIEDITAALSHNYVAKVTPATCEGGGRTLHICEGCGSSFITDYTDPLGLSLIHI